ncbi:MAG: aminotransferase class V-fold PLP-dependent enzyme [Coriobacteriia bacterium]|nr:aminotransferase class V-fold PLP-dependent enzyme [Coriobacteriia bacterium]
MLPVRNRRRGANVPDPHDQYDDTHRATAEAAFLAGHPGYDAAAIAALRATDYARLDATGSTYLDHTGAGLYAASQVDRHRDVLASGVFGNPHSHNPSALASTALVERARASVLEHLNADPAEYDVIFTGNASGALKLVGEAFPFTSTSTYVLLYDNHNSVNGIREFARRAGARTVYVPVRPPELRLDADLLQRALAEPCDPLASKLFAYPGQSNFSGVKHPLDWVACARELGWTTILDAAAFLPTNRLDLAEIKPDFLPISFYKMFGYPTGAGALVARHEALRMLCRPWFAGGTITLASVQAEGWYRLAPGHSGFEDGTVDFLGLPAVAIGLEHLARVGVERINARVMALADWLLAEMTTAAHGDGSPLVRIFGPTTTEARGATIAFYLLDPAGEVYDVERVERLAGEQGISLRTGCFCNPGDGEVAHEITRDEMATCFEEPEVPVTLGDCQRIIHDHTGKVPNTIRVSLGISSDFGDVWRFMRFVAGFRDRDAGGI